MNTTASTPVARAHALSTSMARQLCFDRFEIHGASAKSDGYIRAARGFVALALQIDRFKRPYQHSASRQVAA